MLNVYIIYCVIKIFILISFLQYCHSNLIVSNYTIQNEKTLIKRDEFTSQNTLLNILKQNIPDLIINRQIRHVLPNRPKKMLLQRQNPPYRPSPKLQAGARPPPRPTQRQQRGPSLKAKPLYPAKNHTPLTLKPQSKLPVRPSQKPIQKPRLPLKPKLGVSRQQPLRRNPLTVRKLAKLLNQKQQSLPRQKLKPISRQRPKQNLLRPLAQKPANKGLKSQQLLNRRMKQPNNIQTKIRKIQQSQKNTKSFQVSKNPPVIRRHLPPFRLLNSQKRQQQRNRLLQKQKRQKQNARLLQRRIRQRQRNRLVQRQKRNQQRTKFLQRQRQQNQSRRTQMRRRNNLQKRIRNINRLKRIFTQRRARLQQRINRLKALLRRQNRPAQTKKTTKKLVVKPNPTVVSSQKPPVVNPGGKGTKVPNVVNPKPGGGVVIPGPVVVPGQTGNLVKDDTVGNDAAQSGAIGDETDISNDDIEM